MHVYQGFKNPAILGPFFPAFSVTCTGVVQQYSPRHESRSRDELPEALRRRASFGETQAGLFV